MGVVAGEEWGGEREREVMVDIGKRGLLPSPKKKTGLKKYEIKERVTLDISIGSW